MEKKWILITESYDGLSKTAINCLTATIATYLPYVLPVKLINEISENIYREYNIILVGRSSNARMIELCNEKECILPTMSEEYSIFVGKNIYNEQFEMIAIVGNDEKGILYGCMDFCNRYCGKELLFVEDHNQMFNENFFSELFENSLREWKVHEKPSIPTRAIWTWGHVIYDYKNFLMNMSKLRLNEIVIWNDYIPFNAKEIVNFAHFLGIKVIWGFAWGWGLNCADEMQKFTSEGLNILKENVLSVFETQYASTAGDGIYFQSFTELNTDNVGEKCIAEVVTNFVNDVAGELLNRYPSLHIQFGLHATSVKNQLQYLKKLDKRVCIVWEDCGAFPYAYRGEQTENFEETKSLVCELMKLRGEEEKFGSVLKGMVNLDWKHFKYATGSTIIGESSAEFIKRRQTEKNRLWKIVQANWLKNAEYARVIISEIEKNSQNPIIQGLVEDGMFENEIMFPVALFADLLWNPNRKIEDVIEAVAKYPCVKFANI